MEADRSIKSVNEAVCKARLDYSFPDSLESSPLKSLLDVLEQAVARFPKQPAVTSLGNTLNYKELDALSTTFAIHLKQSTSFQAGDRIAIQMPSLSQYLVVAYGAFKAGLVVVNINPLYTEVELEYQFSHAGIRGVVVFDKFLPVIEAVAKKVVIKHIFVATPFDLHPPVKREAMTIILKLLGRSVPFGKATPLRQALSGSIDDNFIPAILNPDDMALLQYTGGTTGVSKPAIISHGNLISVARQGWVALEHSGAKMGVERIVSPLPLYHIYAFALVLTIGIYMGSHTLLIPNPKDIHGFVSLLRKWPATMFSGLNTLFVALMEHQDFKKINFSALKITLSGGAALVAAPAEAWKSMTGCEISDAYGLTEASPIVSFCPKHSGKIGSVGIAMPETELRIADSSGKPLGVDEHGEIWVKGPQVMQGYLNFPEETVKTLTEDGWLKTGDIGSVDTDGFLYVHDRQKDMIIVSGFNVYPNEIENVISHHPDVTYCAVIGVPDDDSGEAVKLFLVSSNSNLTEEEVRSFYANQLARYKWPRDIVFRDELPLSNIGKVLRRELRDN